MSSIYVVETVPPFLFGSAFKPMQTGVPLWLSGEKFARMRMVMKHTSFWWKMRSLTDGRMDGKNRSSGNWCTSSLKILKTRRLCWQPDLQ